MTAPTSPTTHPSQEHNYHPKYRPDIDGLRALAILPVVAYHAYPHSFPGGFVGVDVFFVISGFLISRIIFESLRDGDFSFVEFYAHRVKRIYPALVVVLAAFFAFGWFALLPQEYAQFGKHMAASSLFVQNFALWLEAGYFDTASDLKPLLHLWSLAVEEQFYLFYPLMIWAVWRLRLNVLAFVIVTALVSFAFNVHEARVDSTGDFFLPHTRFWELLAGAVLAWHHHFGSAHIPAWLRGWVFHPRLFRPGLFGQAPDEARQHALLADVISALGLGLILYSVFRLDRSLAFPGGWALLPVLGAFFIMLAGRAAWVNARILAARPLVFIGLISYPLYLWHWPLLAFAHIMNESRIVAVLLAFLLAWLTYKLVERPLRFGRRTWVKTAALCALMAGLGYAGYNDYSRDGLAFRSSVKSVAAFDEENFEWESKGLLHDEGCYQRFPFMRNQVCKVAKPSAPTVALLGDSHANALYPGLAEATAADAGVNVVNLAEPGQAPLVGVESGMPDDPADKLKAKSQAFDDALAYVETTPSVRTVIIASRGPMYLTGYFPWHHAGDACDYVMRVAGHPKMTDPDEIWRHAMREEIAGLVAHGKQVIVVLDVAELGFHPRECVDERPLRFTAFKPRATCAVPRAEVDARNRAYRALVASVVQEFPMVTVYDAAAPLCDAQWCWATRGGQIVYRDGDHLNLAGSRLEAAALARLLAR